MQQPTPKDWYNFHRGIIPQPKKKPFNYSLLETGTNIIRCRGTYPLCKSVQKQYPHSKIIPNY